MILHTALGLVPVLSVPASPQNPPERPEAMEWLIRG